MMEAKYSMHPDNKSDDVITEHDVELNVSKLLVITREMRL